MTSGVWPDSRLKKASALWAEVNKMECLRGYEVCISQIRRQETSLKSRQYILRVIIQYSSRNTGTIQIEKHLKIK